MPNDPRVLWSIHAGQRADGNGFVGIMDLLRPEGAIGEREDVLSSIEFLREDPDSWVEAGISQEEAESEEWICIAARDHDKLVVNAQTGRVFTSPTSRSLRMSVMIRSFSHV